MQVKVKSTKVLSKGTSDYGEWKLVQVTTSEDVKYTTLAKEADNIAPGSTINIKDMDKDDQGRESFKKYEIAPGGQVSAPPATNEMTTEMWAEKDRVKNTSIETQNAYTGIPATVELYKKYPDDPLAQVAYNYAVSKLSNWSSMGEVEKPEEEMITPDQVARIKKAAEKYKDDIEVYKTVMKDAYRMTNYKKLNSIQAEDFIQKLEAEEGLKEIEPEDIPFK